MACPRSTLLLLTGEISDGMPADCLSLTPEPPRVLLVTLVNLSAELKLDPSPKDISSSETDSSL
jgi:hypothetical protein